MLTTREVDDPDALHPPPAYGGGRCPSCTNDPKIPVRPQSSVPLAEPRPRSQSPERSRNRVSGTETVVSPPRTKSSARRPIAPIAPRAPRVWNYTIAKTTALPSRTPPANSRFRKPTSALVKLATLGTETVKRSGRESTRACEVSSVRRAMAPRGLGVLASPRHCNYTANL